ncbi:MAG: ATP-binding cassette domain-containing protein, partial [Bacteroidales bacterium]|nr:ATP-binding cassette domain-containing protein [Bacteroidales bacterium]
MSNSNTSSHELIKIQNLYKVFGRKPQQVMSQVRDGIGKDELLAKHDHTLGLKDINLTINKGEIFVIMGLSGSGKSTLIRHFNRLIDPTEGQILVDGVDVIVGGDSHSLLGDYSEFGIKSSGPYPTKVTSAAG